MRILGVLQAVSMKSCLGEQSVCKQKMSSRVFQLCVSLICFGMDTFHLMDREAFGRDEK